jgi:hypothetical protein
MNFLSLAGKDGVYTVRNGLEDGIGFLLHDE